MKWLAILNVGSGHNSPTQVQQLERAIEHQLDVCCVRVRRLVTVPSVIRAHPECDGVIAVGGDGTISTVANALPARALIATIPAGTGNGLARDLHLDTPHAALRAISQPELINLDRIRVRFCQQGRWYERWMISTSGIGYLAGATRLAYAHKRHLHLFSHFVGAICQPFLQREFRIRLRLDDTPWQERDVTSVAVHNTQYVGNFRLFPEARVDDGQLNVLYGRLSPWGQIAEDAGTFLGLYRPHLSTHRQACQCDIEVDPATDLMVDGDLYAAVSAINYEIEPGGLVCVGGRIRAGVETTAVLH